MKGGGNLIIGAAFYIDGGAAAPPPPPPPPNAMVDPPLCVTEKLPVDRVQHKGKVSIDLTKGVSHANRTVHN